MVTYEESHMCLICHILDGHLGQHGTLIIVECELVLRDDIDEV